MRLAWQGQRLSSAPRRQPRTAPHRPSGRALGGGRLADKSDGKRNEWIERSGRATFLRNEGAWVVGLTSWPSNRASGRTDTRFIALPYIELPVFMKNINCFLTYLL